MTFCPFLGVVSDSLLKVAYVNLHTIQKLKLEGVSTRQTFLRWIYLYQQRMSHRKEHPTVDARKKVCPWE